MVPFRVPVPCFASALAPVDVGSVRTGVSFVCLFVFLFVFLDGRLDFAFELTDWRFD